jgi:hypothetical protein
MSVPDSNRIPDWEKGDLPVAPELSWRHWTRFIGPGIVMMGIQIGGGEWLFGPEITARYGGGLMWVATVAIVLQVFYNIECGRYAMYCGEPVFTGFLRTRPGPRFWMAVILMLNLSSLIPGLSTHGAAMAASLILDRPPSEADRGLVTVLAYIFLFAVALPVLLGGKVYNMLQAVMTTKVVVVLGFCLIIGVLFVSGANWANVFGGFLKFGTVPVTGPGGREGTVNLVTNLWSGSPWPEIAMGNIALLGAFAGYAGGGGLANATYGNFVRDKGWGMGGVVGAIPSAVGGRNIVLSHVGRAFPPTAGNLARWRGWWRYVLTDQILVWAPGCFMGMALPALLSLEFAPHSTLVGAKLDWAQSLITADGIRHAPGFGPDLAKWLWTLAVGVGLLVMLPSQMSIVDDFSRRWTDLIWSGSRRVRERMAGGQVRWIYFGILGGFVIWSVVCTYLFSTYGTPKLMTLVIANLNNLALGVTAFHLVWINRTLLPRELRPRWYSQLGVLACGVFYLGLAWLVFLTKQWPMLKAMF